MSDLPLLMALRVQGIVSVDRAATALGVDADDARTRLAKLAANELVTERTGRLAGYTLTPAGVDALDEALGAEGLRGDVRLVECYERFMQLNPRVLKVCSDWQVRRDGAVETPNDHEDAAYDASVIDRLLELHERARTRIANIAERAPRFAVYISRLDDCVRQLEDGDRSAFTTPMAESYHTVWFELHQDLLLTLGLQREE